MQRRGNKYCRFRSLEMFLQQNLKKQLEGAVYTFSQIADDYHGFWVGGGLLNNLPLHTFNYLEQPFRRII